VETAQENLNQPAAETQQPPSAQDETAPQSTPERLEIEDFIKGKLQVKLTVSLGSTAPGPSQYSSKRADYSLETTVNTCDVEKVRDVMERLINSWLPKQESTPPSESSSAAPPEAPSRAAPQTKPPVGLDPKLPFVEAVKQYIEKGIQGHADLVGKLEYKEDDKGNAIIHPTEYLGGPRFKVVADIVASLEKMGYAKDYDKDSSNTHWTVKTKTPHKPAPAASAPKPAATAGLDPNKLESLPWKTYSKPSYNARPGQAAWIFANTQGAEELFMHLQMKGESQVTIGDRSYTCRISGVNGEWINRSPPGEKK
jgi:hypothetical protein